MNDHSTIIVVWGFIALASAAIAANIAYRRGLNDTAYFLAGLFLGIIGILAAAFMPLPPHWAPTRGRGPMSLVGRPRVNRLHQHRRRGRRDRVARRDCVRNSTVSIALWMRFLGHHSGGGLRTGSGSVRGSKGSMPLPYRPRLRCPNRPDLRRWRSRCAGWWLAGSCSLPPRQISTMWSRMLDRGSGVFEGDVDGMAADSTRFAEGGGAGSDGVAFEPPDAAGSWSVAAHVQSSRTSKIANGLMRAGVRPRRRGIGRG